MERVIKKYFALAYQRIQIHVEEIEKREFGIGKLGKKIYKRHMMFLSDDELNAFLRNEAPLYISRSAAYYQFPSEEMEKKIFLGADLVFDLDAEQFNQRIKDETIRLYDILREDFGFKDISINFSGNRGFHVHVLDKEVRNYGKKEREEIVKYLRLEGFSAYTLLEIYRSFQQGKELLARDPYARPGPAEKSKGMPARFFRAVERLVNERAKRFLKNGDWRFVTNDILAEAENLIRIGSINVDAAVTTDLTKLIRVPNSIHGSTGLQAKVLPPSKVDDFQLVDAVCLPSEFLKVYVLKDTTALDEKIARGWQKLPAYLAIYLLLKEKARLRP